MEDHVDDHEAYERRRNQVRRAQKSHRTRKALYFKSLEEEISELREQNAALLKGTSIQYLREIISQFQNVLVANNLTFPPYDFDKPCPDDLTAIEVTGNSYNTQCLKAQLLPSYVPCENSRSATQLLHASGLQNITQISFDFILALEQPCLSHRNHIPPDLLITEGMGANGHELMLSSPIRARGPESNRISSVDEEYPLLAKWTVLTAELEGLLRLSQGLGLGIEEVTPVQAWQIITQHNRFESLTFELLERMRLVLLPMVKCYGFGAVIERAEFENVLNEMFS
ncbi:hypothetical protein VTL71DRAFT_14023 [Oculimacula yallundae]|uniref:BZIP domain-containing protein n=1 Tax=Oculimacula yallundae TaxID=86028 RepID=A0ABR4CNA5_9HELO